MNAKLKTLSFSTLKDVIHPKPPKLRLFRWEQSISLGCFWLGIILLFAATGQDFRGQLLQIAFTLIGLIPVFILVFGFATWRNLCPLALHGTLAGKFRRPSKMHRPWSARWWIPLIGLVGFVYLRLLGLNAIPGILAGLLVLMTGGAVLCGHFFGGRSWCHYFCPMGPVERLFEQAAWRIDPRSNASMCRPCVGCIQKCPDINFQASQRAKVHAPGNHFFFYGYPGLVAGFVGWPWLHQGSLAAWLQSKWYFEANPLKTLTGTGFFFWPLCPKWIAVALTLLATTALSYWGFCWLEQWYLPEKLQDVAARTGAGMFTLCVLLPPILPWTPILLIYLGLFLAVFWIALIPTMVSAK